MTSFNVSTTAGLQTALTQAQAGDTILLASGTYSGLSIQNLAKSNVTITSQNLAAPAVLTQFSMSGSSGLTFSHLDFSTVGSTDPIYAFRVNNCQNITYDSLTVHGVIGSTPFNNPSAFFIQNSSNLNVTNSSFQYLQVGIVDYDNQHVNVSSNNFQWMGVDGIDNAGASFVQINNNTFTNFLPGPGAHPDCIQFWTEGTTGSAHDITITGNVYTRGAGGPLQTQGIFVQDDGGTQPYLNVTITGNEIYGGAYNGIYVLGGQNLNVSNNIVAGYADMESWIYGSKVSGAVSNNRAQTYLLGGNTGLTQANDVTISAVASSAPVLANSGSAVTFAAGGAAADIAHLLSLTDTAVPTVASATVAITGGFLAGDALNFVNQNGITGSYNAATGVLTLSGSEAQTVYQTALESITFSSSVVDPTHGGADASRAISFSVNDGAHSSNSLAASVSVTAPPPASPPSLSNSGGAGAYQVGGAAASVAQSLAVTDTATSTLASASVAIAGGFVTGDALNFTNQNGITGSYNAANGVLTLTGAASLANYQSALDSITFSSSNHDPTHSAPTDPTDGAPDPSRAVTFTVNDGWQNSNSIAASVGVTVASQPQPGLANAGSTATFQAGGAAADIAQQLAVTDTTSTTIASATVAITTGFIVGDALGFLSQSGITGSYNAAAGVLTLTGSASLATYQAALDSITFASSAADPTHAPPADPTDGGPDPLRAITFTVNDGHSANSLVADVAVTNPSAAPASVAAASVTVQAAVASAALVPITSVAASPVVTGSMPPPAAATSPVNFAPALDSSHLSALNQSLSASNLMHALAGVGGVTGSIGSGDFIFSPATQALGLTGGVGALASGATSSNHLDLTGIGALIPAFQAAVSPAPMGFAGAVGDSLVFHQTDFVLPLLGGHSLASSHPLLT